MSIRKETPLSCERIDMGSLRIGMSAQTTDPIIQVIDTDHENVRPLRVIGFHRGNRADADETEADQKPLSREKS